MPQDALAGAGWDCACGTTALRTLYCPACGRSNTPSAPQLYVAVARPPRAGLTRAGKALAALLAAVLFAGLNTLVLRSEARTAAERRDARAALDHVVAELSAFVARAHGGPFLHPVQSALVGDDAFRVALFGDPTEAVDQDATDDTGDEPADFGATLVGLGLADPAEDLGQTQTDVLDDSVVGLYDPEKGELFVRGKALTPYVRMVLVHELTHAWQDQHYDLGAVKDRADDDDADTAIRALIEGDARRVEDAWRAAQPADVQAAIDAVENGDSVGTGTPTRATRALDQLGALPYYVGERFVTALVSRGGNAAVDKAFADPPRSTAQVFDPARYLRHDKPVAVPDPHGAGDVVDEGRLGQLALTIVANGDRTDGFDIHAADGWAGDSYLTWTSDTTWCTNLTVEFRTAADAERLAEALRARRFTITESGRLVDATSCVHEQG